MEQIQKTKEEKPRCADCYFYGLRVYSMSHAQKRGWHCEYSTGPDMTPCKNFSTTRGLNR